MDALATLQLGLPAALASALMHSLWQVTVLAGLAWLALAGMPRARAATRHAVAMGFLVAMVVVPVLTCLRFWEQPVVALRAGWLPAIAAPRLEAASGVYVQDANPVASLLALAWLAGVALMLLHRLAGWRFVGALDRLPSQPLPAPWQARVDALRQAMGITRDVAVRLSADVLAPFTARLLRPVVWLPLSLLANLPREQVEALIAHELAHIARLDWLWNGLQCVVESLLFFHPAAWWLGRRIRAEREHACDDLAVAACGDAVALAEALVTLERGRHPVPHLVLAAQGGSLMQRITRLLSTPPSRGRWGAAATLGVVLGVGTLLAVQVAGGATRPGIHVRATTDGPLGPGDSREITARGLGGERYYRESLDAQGRRSETYKVDGETRPVDAGVHRWVAEVMRLSVPPPPPAPPAPPPPMVPPPPPAPPSLADSALFQSLIARVAADPQVVAAIGSPIATVGDEQIHGRLDMGDGPRPDGSANLRLDLRGPKGAARVAVDSELVEGRWSTPEVQILDRR